MRVAEIPLMARRLTALVGIVVIVSLALALMWRVYLHHQQIRDVEEVPAVVEHIGDGKLARALL